MAVAMEVAWRGGGGMGELASSSTPPGVSIQDVEASLKMKNNAGSTNKMNKRAWGADAHKLVQLMMNPLQQQQSHAGGELGGKKVADVEEEEGEEFTLDLLGASSPPSKSQKLAEEKDELREVEPRSAEFLELQPADQPLPLPTGWEKCLDLKTGKLYFVNKSTGMTTSPEITHNKCYTHKFLNNMLKSSSSSEEEELEELIQTSTCPSQSALMGSKPPLLAFSSGSKQLNIIKTAQEDHHHAKDQETSTSKFELDLNLTASGSTSPSHHQPPQPPHPQEQVEQLRPESSSAAVCTMEMVQRALNRAEKAMGKREMQAPRNPHRHHNHHHHHHHSGAPASSSSSSALIGGAMSEATSSRSPNSATSSSNSSSTSSTSSASLLAGSSGATAAATTEGGIQEQTFGDPFVVTSKSGVWEGGESKEDSLQRKMKGGQDESEARASEQSMLVTEACTRCLMYVMLNKCDPKCPRCESQVPLDFTNATHPPPAKRQRLERHESPLEHAQD